MDQYPIVVSQFEKNYMHLKAVRGIDFAVRKGKLELRYKILKLCQINI